MQTYVCICVYGSTHVFIGEVCVTSQRLLLKLSCPCSEEGTQ